MRKIFIPCRNESVTRLLYDTVQRKAGNQMYNPVVSGEVKASTRINALAVVVRVLEQFEEMDLTAEKEPNVIFTVGMVSDSIHNGTYKFWLLNEGKMSDGSAINATELELWQKFNDLYPKMYSHIIIKNIATCVLPRSNKYPVTQEKRNEINYAKIAWEKINIATPEVEETAGEAI